jgi:hypothetical protein
MATKQAAFALMIEGDEDDEVLMEAISISRNVVESIARVINQFPSDEDSGHSVIGEVTEWVPEW